MGPREYYQQRLVPLGQQIARYMVATGIPTQDELARLTGVYTPGGEALPPLKQSVISRVMTGDSGRPQDRILGRIAAVFEALGCESVLETLIAVRDASAAVGKSSVPRKLELLWLRMEMYPDIVQEHFLAAIEQVVCAIEAGYRSGRNGDG